MHKAAELPIIQNMAASVWENLARGCQWFLLTELAEVCNYVKFPYFNSNFTYIADAFGKSLEGHYLGCDKRIIYTWLTNAAIFFWLRFFNIESVIFTK